MSCNTTFDALLFDMDGTLVDSTDLVERTWTAFAERNGLSPEQVIDFAHGRPTAETVKRFLGEGDGAQAEIDDIVAAEAVDVSGVRAVAGAQRVLSQVTDSPWAVVTSAGRAVALARFAAAGLPVPEILITPEDVEEGKPAPDGYLLAARALGVSADRCIVFEDAGPGISAGLASTAQVVVVGAYSGEEAVGLARISDFEDIDVIGGKIIRRHQAVTT